MRDLLRDLPELVKFFAMVGLAGVVAYGVAYLVTYGLCWLLLSLAP